MQSNTTVERFSLLLLSWLHLLNCISEVTQQKKLGVLKSITSFSTTPKNRANWNLIKWVHNNSQCITTNVTVLLYKKFSSVQSLYKKEGYKNILRKRKWNKTFIYYCTEESTELIFPIYDNLDVSVSWCAENQVAQSCTTVCSRMDCIPPGSSVYEILQARKLEWAAIPSSKGSSQLGIEPSSPVLQADSLLSEPPRIVYIKAQIISSWCVGMFCFNGSLINLMKSWIS